MTSKAGAWRRRPDRLARSDGSRFPHGDGLGSPDRHRANHAQAKRHRSTETRRWRSLAAPGRRSGDGAAVTLSIRAMPRVRRSHLAPSVVPRFRSGATTASTASRHHLGRDEDEASHNGPARRRRVARGHRDHARPGCREGPVDVQSMFGLPRPRPRRRWAAARRRHRPPGRFGGRVQLLAADEGGRSGGPRLDRAGGDRLPAEPDRLPEGVPRRQEQDGDRRGQDGLRAGQRGSAQGRRRPSRGPQEGGSAP